MAHMWTYVKVKDGTYVDICQGEGWHMCVHTSVISTYTCRRKDYVYDQTI